MAINDKDFQDLRDKVNTLGQRQDEVVIPALNEIRHVVEKMAFVPLDQYAKDKAAYEEWKASVEKELTNARPAIKFINALNSRWTQVLIGLILAAAVGLVASQFPKIGLG
jgi:hypothetical protein